MDICPVCNGFTSLTEICPHCGGNMEDMGRLMDYYDDYSPYMPIELMKLENGFPDDGANHQCVHLLKCPICGKDDIILIDE